MTVTEKLIQLEKKIQALEKKKEQIEAQLALSFFKSAKRICGDEFCPSFVLETLEQVWNLTSEIQKQEGEKRVHSFRLPPTHSHCKKPQATNPTPHQS